MAAVRFHLKSSCHFRNQQPDSRTACKQPAFTVFFAAFNFLEARLPAQLSKAAPQVERGGALGVFATCQFLGSAFGGAIGGQLQQHWGVSGVFWGSAIVATAWAVIASRSGVHPSAIRT